MNHKEYLENVLKTESINFDSIKSRMQSEFVIRLDHVSDGLCTEAGEFKDQLKKFKFYGRDLDIINLVEELGDTLWYVGIACNVLGISMDEVMEKNIAKLKARYEGKFSEERAENRNLDRERDILRDNSILHFLAPQGGTWCGIKPINVHDTAGEFERVTCNECRMQVERELS